MKFLSGVLGFSVNRPKIVIAGMLAGLLLCLAQFPKIKVDTDPENMLSEKEFVRVFHSQTKKEFALYDFIVLGVVNETSPQGVFNVNTLKKVYALTDKIKGIEGVIRHEIISPSTKDDIEQAGLGAVRFKWLMPRAPDSEEEARRIRDRALDNPLFNGTMVSSDGRALCLYIPIKEKKMSYLVSQKIKAVLSDLDSVYGGGDKYYLTGLPVAEDTFGHQMFIQMAVSAPLAALIIFILMYIFFRNIPLIIAPMILAIVTVLITMGVLIGFGFPVHIMSSMIPIFLMPIAVLDSVHILSEFFDRYGEFRNKKKAITHVVTSLFTPMFYTSLTTWAGFFSLAFSPNPPVRVFGLFVSLGVVIAWILTIVFIPAYTVLIPDKVLRNFNPKTESELDADPSFLDRVLSFIARFSFRGNRIIIAAAMFIACISIYGISRIEINDNPVKWFSKKHEIRISDKVLNHHFSGTYMAYLVLEAEAESGAVFKTPEMLNYLIRLQSYLLSSGYVGKTTALPDVVKKIYFELTGANDRKYYSIPKTKEGVAQCLISFENSHKPDDLWHFVTPDYSKLNLWIQLKSGDNKDMEKVLSQVDSFFKDNRPPYALNRNWAGLTYVNVAWQNKMVSGMLRSFLGSFVIVYFMMVFLFSSPARALISMIPLTLTVIFMYGLLGLAGRNYDMPVAVLSALTLGLSVDFAIHFLQRSQEIFNRTKDWGQACRDIFKGPARAIFRNAVVIAVGFLPLLLAPLVPYQTVGLFMFLIMFVSGIATLFILPAIVSFRPFMFLLRRDKHFLCFKEDCRFFTVALSLSLVYILLSYTSLSISWTISIALLALIILLIACGAVLNMEPVCRFLKRR